jgi:hypothetical protein
MVALTSVNNVRLFGPASGKRQLVRLFAENLVHEINGVPGAELFQQIGSMEIDGTRADAECPCGLLARGASNDLSQRNTFS